MRTLSQQVSTLQDRVWELERSNTMMSREKGKLKEQLEETKVAAQAISSQKEEVERTLKSEKENLRLEVLNVAEKCCQFEAGVKKLKKELCELEEAKEVAAKAFDVEKVEMRLQLEDLKRRLEETKASKDLAESQNDKLRSEALIAEEKQAMSEAEIERLKMELGALVEAKEASAKAFDAQNAEIVMELEDLKRKMEEMQTNMGLVEDENDKLQSKVLVAEEKYSKSEAEIKCLKAMVCALVESKEAAAKAFDTEKVEMMKESDSLKRQMEEIKASKDLVENENNELRSEILAAEQKCSLLEAEVKSLKMELCALVEAKEAAAKAFDAEKAETLKELESLRREVEEIQVNKHLLEAENGRLQSEVVAAEQNQGLLEAKIQKLKMDLVALTEMKEEAIKAFDAEKSGITKELGDLKKKAEVIQAKKDLVEGENDKLRLEVLIAEQKHSMSELEIKRLKMDLIALAEAKETVVKSLDVEKAKFMKELEDLNRTVEEIHASKVAADEVGRNKVAEAEKLRAELDDIRVSMSQLQASYNELDAKHSRLNDEKNLVQKALDGEKVEASKLKSKLEELENYKAKKDLTVALVPQKNKGSILSYLCSK